MKDKLKMVIPEDIIRRIIDSDVTFEKYFDISKEKERNIMINLTKYLIKNNKYADYEFSYDEIRSHILIKDIDYIVYKEKLFDVDKFKLNKEVIGMINKYIDTHFFNLNCDNAIKVINKYCDDKIITSNDLIEILNFALHNKSLLDKERPQTPYNLNRVFFKDFLRKCVSDINFIKILFSKELNSIIKLTFFEKIGMILGF